MQLLRFVAAERWKVPANDLNTPALGRVHQWTYRGQVIPSDREVTVQAILTSVDDERRSLTAKRFALGGWPSDLSDDRLQP